MSKLRFAIATALFAMAPVAAAGGQVRGSLPEPETLALLAVAALALIIAKGRKRK